METIKTVQSHKELEFGQRLFWLQTEVVDGLPRAGIRHVIVKAIGDNCIMWYPYNPKFNELYFTIADACAGAARYFMNLTGN